MEANPTRPPMVKLPPSVEQRTLAVLERIETLLEQTLAALATEAPNSDTPVAGGKKHKNNGRPRG